MSQTTTQEPRQTFEWGDDEAYPAAEFWDEEDSTEYDVVKPDRVDRHCQAFHGATSGPRSFDEHSAARLEQIIQMQEGLARRHLIPSPWMAPAGRSPISLEEAWMAFYWGDAEAYPASEPWDDEDSVEYDAVKPDRFASLDPFETARSSADSDAFKYEGGICCQSQSTHVTDESDESLPDPDNTFSEHSSQGTTSEDDQSPRDFDEHSGGRQPLPPQDAQQALEWENVTASPVWEAWASSDKAEHDAVKPDVFPILEDQFGFSAIGA